MLGEKLYVQLARSVGALNNCIQSGNSEWEDKHTAKIESLVKSYMPSGSGFDTGTKICLNNCTAEKLVFTIDFHHMDDNGMYDGWKGISVIYRGNEIRARRRQGGGRSTIQTINLWTSGPKD